MIVQILVLGEPFAVIFCEPTIDHSHLEGSWHLKGLVLVWMALRRLRRPTFEDLLYFHGHARCIHESSDFEGMSGWKGKNVGLSDQKQHNLHNSLKRWRKNKSRIITGQNKRVYFGTVEKATVSVRVPGMPACKEALSQRSCSPPRVA